MPIFVQIGLFNYKKFNRKFRGPETNIIYISGLIENLFLEIRLLSIENIYNASKTVLSYKLALTST